MKLRVRKKMDWVDRGLNGPTPAQRPSLDEARLTMLSRADCPAEERKKLRRPIDRNAVAPCKCGCGDFVLVGAMQGEGSGYKQGHHKRGT